MSAASLAEVSSADAIWRRVDDVRRVLHAGRHRLRGDWRSRGKRVRTPACDGINDEVESLSCTSERHSSLSSIPHDDCRWRRKILTRSSRDDGDGLPIVDELHRRDEAATGQHRLRWAVRAL